MKRSWPPHRLSRLAISGRSLVTACVWLICSQIVCSQRVCAQVEFNATSDVLEAESGQPPAPIVSGSTFQLGVTSEDSIAPVAPVALWQPTPLIEPRVSISEDGRGIGLGQARVLAPTASAGRVRVGVSEAKGFESRDVVRRAEALPKATSDLGDLLKKSPSVPSVQVQSKTPIVHDPRIRGSRIGSLAAAGSHWVPARIDLDTMVSKFDSRQVARTVVTPGPYTSLLGPGFDFVDVQLLGSPRTAQGLTASGSTDAEYRSNGDQTFAQQSILLGDTNWGTRFNYANRQGGDYQDGNGVAVPSSYNSQEMILALGRDWIDDSIEVNVLRLDQTDVIFPGYVFDIDTLVTDGYEVTHTHRGWGMFDTLETEAWYNRTRFNGNAQNVRKRAFFPVLDLAAYQGFTDVDSMSTGYRQSLQLGAGEDYRLTIGHDLRFIKQELNEISNSVLLGIPLPVSNRNSPIPKSTIVNPGLFAEYEEQFTEDLQVKLGGRVDYAGTNIVDDANKLAAVGLNFIPASYAEIVGTNDYERDFQLVSSFLTAQHRLAEEHSVSAGLGYAERAPNLTELYAAQPFILLLQNGLNNVTGDPTLKRERLLQVDLGYEFSHGLCRSGVRSYYAWAFDYITFENTRTFLLPPLADTRQVSLRYVNTDLATLAGLEAFSELFPESPLTPFGNIRFVEGVDRSRNGSFATTNGSAGSPSQKVVGQTRGAASGVAGGATESLPGMPPLESRLGVRWHDVSPAGRWSAELSVRMVARQNQVAASLLESPTAGFSTIDLRSVFRPLPSDAWVIATGIENLTDRHYREHFDYRTPSGLAVYQPGANFYISTNLTY